MLIHSWCICDFKRTIVCVNPATSLTVVQELEGPSLRNLNAHVVLLVPLLRVDVRNEAHNQSVRDLYLTETSVNFLLPLPV